MQMIQKMQEGINKKEVFSPQTLSCLTTVNCSLCTLQERVQTNTSKQAKTFTNGSISYTLFSILLFSQNYAS